MRVVIVLTIILFSGSIYAERQPNVVLFLADDLGWRDLGCQGSEYYKTPNIDRLASGGIRFTNAYAACCVCSPTRASILTGKYPARLMLTQWIPAGRWDPEKHRMREGRFLRALPLEEITLAETLRDAGYATIHVGKWHLGGPLFSLPEHHGFVENVAGSTHGAPGSYFYPFEGKWEIPTTGKKVIKKTLVDGREGDYLTDRISGSASELIRKYKDQPFFLYLPFYAVHTPLQAKKDKVARYQEIPEEERQGKPAYAAMIESLDEGVGRVMETLGELGLEDNTVVIFTSDNGGYARATDNSPLRANKGAQYEGGLRVPLIVRSPGMKGRGGTCDVPAISNDLYPTVLELAGLPPLPLQHVDGVSLVPLLEGKETDPERSLFWHYPHYNRHPSNAPASVIRRGQWKLIENLETGDVELYDLSVDLGETRDQAKERPEVARELLQALRKWKGEVGADPMKPNPQFLGE